MNNPNRKKGFVFTIQSIIALLLLTLFFLSLQQESPSSLKELQIIQQENDLFRVWSTKETNESEMIKDLKFLFGENAELVVNSKKVLAENGDILKNCISSDGQILTNPFLIEKNITLKVCD